MRRSIERSDWPLALVPLAGAFFALVGGASSPTLAPFGVAPQPLFLLATGFLMTLAALHRPAGGATPGIAAALFLPAVHEFGALPAAWLLGAALVGAEFGRRAIEKGNFAPLPERRGALRIAGAVATAILSSFVAVGVWIRAEAEGLVAAKDWGPLAAATALTAAAWILPGALFELFERRLQRAEPAGELVRGLAPLGIDALGLAVGSVLLLVQSDSGRGVAVTLWILVAALAAEAARHELASSARARLLEESERVSSAGHDIVAKAAGFAAIAEKVHAGCVEILPSAWFHFELEAGDEGPLSWFAAPSGPIVSGEALMPRIPPALPGVHRRGRWKVVERELVDEGQRLGRLRLSCDSRTFDERKVELLDGLIPQMTASIRVALRQREATIDRLTGLFVRRVLEQRLTDAFARSREAGTPLAVVLGDLDHFKRINDTFGHATGDRALRAIAAILRGPNRGDEIAARWGGEEFVLLYEDVDGKEAIRMTEQLRHRIESHDFDVGGQRVPLTMSFGVAAIPEVHAAAPEELVQLADEALYTAKELGRNMCLLHTGRGRVEFPNGETVDVAERLEEVKPPVFFAR